MYTGCVGWKYTGCVGLMYTGCVGWMYTGCVGWKYTGCVVLGGCTQVVLGGCTQVVLGGWWVVRDMAKKLMVVIRLSVCCHGDCCFIMSIIIIPALISDSVTMVILSVSMVMFFCLEDYWIQWRSVAMT